MKIKAKGNELESSIMRTGKNQRQFAEDVVCMSKVHLNRIITGRTSPSSEMAYRISTALNKSFDELFEIVEEEKHD